MVQVQPCLSPRLAAPPPSPPPRPPLPLHSTKTSFPDASFAQQIHGQLILTGTIHDPTSLDYLLSLYLSTPPNSGGLAAARPPPRRILPLARRPSAAICNSLIRRLLNHNLPFSALLSYSEMLQKSQLLPDRFTFPSLLKACAHSMASSEGRIIHGQALRCGLADDLYIQATLISMYAAFGDVESAMAVFNRTNGDRNQVIWDSMISGLVKNNYPGEALRLFSKMAETQVEADEVTWTSAIAACAELKELETGRKLHSTITQGRRGRSVVLDTALVDMYAKCGVPDMAKKVFDEMPERNVVTWSAIISGFLQNGRGEEALVVFETMLAEGVVPNAVTLAAALSACAQTGNLNAGKWIHAYVARSGMEFSTSLQNSMVDMYAKCGNIDVARRLFDEMPSKDVVSWNVIISGLAMHGQGKLALEKFSQMEREGFEPDDITFIGVLSACSHGRLVEEGLRHYRDMRRVYGISPKLEHDGCMVDMLCRARRFKEAEEFIGQMVEEPGEEVWGALLGGCAVFDELGLGEHAAQRLVGEVNPGDDGAYVLLSNMLARRRRWGDARSLREVMEDRGIRKTPGCSSIDVDGVLYEFFSGESLNQE